MNSQRRKITVGGAVQGVGFRPFVYRLARDLHLAGWVANSGQGVFIEVEGGPEPLEEFLIRLETDKPSAAIVQSLRVSRLPPAGLGEFEIRPSSKDGEKTAFVLPDIATCLDCLREIFDPANRRHLYPFTNCTHCGPRFSIIEALPYDRGNTSMKKFAMCAECEREYHDALDRRFHAQPNACPNCGPHLELWDAKGKILARCHDALLTAASEIRSARIVALKGIGGFQLFVDARNEDAVRVLRQGKHREEKPFALMYPSLESVREECRVSELEERLLLSPEAPIALLERRSQISNFKSEIAPNVAPGNPSLGIMLPYSPLHYLLMRELSFPVVATSGNLSDEPICTDEEEALERLQGIADVFLVHDRPIVRHVDDSIVCVMLDREMMLRRARGYAPLPVAQIAPTILSLGAHLKNSVALSAGGSVFVSQHIGDLETPQAHAAFRNVVSDLPRLYEADPEAVACDLHPDYVSTRYAQQLGPPVIAVQHHYAHVLSCMAEHELNGSALGVAWDGTGLGTDGTIWGGEFLVVNEKSFERAAHFRQFRLPGGDASIKEPRRTALGVLYEIFGEKVFERRELIPVQSFSESELRLLRPMLRNAINAPITSSAGRLFDAVAALIGLRQEVHFEGQAALELEFAVQSGITEAYRFHLKGSEPLIIDWEPAVLEILSDIARGEESSVMTAKFHNGLTEAITAVARKIGETRIVLTGGCFQNKYLLEDSVRRLMHGGFQVYWHRRIPPNDGGIAVGQIAAAARVLRDEASSEERRIPSAEPCHAIA